MRRPCFPTVLLAVLAGTACQAPPPPGEAVELLARPAEIEWRTDSVVLRDLVARGLGANDWAVEPGASTGHVAWMRRTTASLRLSLFDVGEKHLRLRAAAHPQAPEGTQLVVSLGGSPLGTLALGPEPREATWPVPAAVQQGGDNVLRLEVAGGRHHRPVLVHDLELAGGRGRPGSAPPGLVDGAAWLPPGSSLSTYLRADSAHTLEVDVRPGPAGGGRLEVRAHAGGATEAVLELDASRPRTGRGALRIPAGSIARLELASVGAHGLHVGRARLWRTPPTPAPKLTLPSRPNVIVYLVDTLRADHLGAYGHPRPTSPRFDRFAAEGVLFEDAGAHSSWTRPTVASVFTGLGPLAHRVDGASNVVAADVVTLAEAFRDAGYDTAAFVANGVVQPELGFAQGFATWNDPPLGERSPRARAVVERGVAWMEGRQRPFFLYLHTYEPHAPYRPDPAHWAPFLPAAYTGPRRPDALVRRTDLSPDELRFVRSAYEGEIHQDDAAFGSLLDALAARRLDERTVVVYTADHGEEFKDHGGMGHGSTLYQEVVHVPLAVRLPRGAGRAARDPDPVQQQDLMPSLLTLAGIPVPPLVEGHDLSARFAGRPRPDPAAAHLSVVRYAGRDKLAVRSGRFKLVLNNEEDSPRPRELYDLARDPGETRDVLAEHPEAAGLLLMEARRLGALEEGLARLIRAGEKATLTPAQREELRALGYVE